MSLLFFFCSASTGGSRPCILAARCACRGPDADLLVGLAGLFLRLNSIAFGEPRGQSCQGARPPIYVPMFAHLALVLAAGVCMPPGELSPGSRTSPDCFGVKLMPSLSRLSSPRGSTRGQPSPLAARHRDCGRLAPCHGAAIRRRPARHCSGSGVIPTPRQRSTWRYMVGEATGEIAVAHSRLSGRHTFPPSGRLHPPAIRLERAIPQSLRVRSSSAQLTSGHGSTRLLEREHPLACLSAARRTRRRGAKA